MQKSDDPKFAPAQSCLCQCGFQVAQHWAGSPNEELVKQAEASSLSALLSLLSVDTCEAAEKKARSVQREALQAVCSLAGSIISKAVQETSMLRQHIKRVERKYGPCRCSCLRSHILEMC